MAKEDLRKKLNKAAKKASKEMAKKLWERKQSIRVPVQEMGGNVIFADEWDKIDSGLKKGIGLKGGGISQRGLGRAFKKGGKA